MEQTCVAQAQPMSDSKSQTCTNRKATLSPAEIKARLLRSTAIAAPGGYRASDVVRIKSILAFRIEINQAGNVVCIQATSGSPMLIGAAMDAIRNWQFRNGGTKETPSALAGELVISLVGTKKGLTTTVLERAPDEAGPHP